MMKKTWILFMPLTQTTLVFNWKFGLVLGGWQSKIEIIGALGVYNVMVFARDGGKFPYTSSVTDRCESLFWPVG